MFKHNSSKRWMDIWGYIYFLFLIETEIKNETSAVRYVRFISKYIKNNVEYLFRRVYTMKVKINGK